MNIQNITIKRFWDKVDKKEPTECWEWRAVKDRCGYGRIKINGKFMFAHRISWEICNNSDIPDGMVVLHSCDNPSCVNPKHLRVGTQADNIRDAIAKGRINKRGMAHPMSKLTKEQVIAIKMDLAATKFEYGDMTAFCKKWGNKFGINWMTIRNIVYDMSWKHIKI